MPLKIKKNTQIVSIVLYSVVLLFVVMININSAMASQLNSCEKVFLKDSRWSHGREFSENFSEDGFPLELLQFKGSMQYSSVRALLSTPTQQEFHTLDFGSGKIRSIEAINDSIYMFRFVTIDQRGDEREFAKSYSLNDKIPHASPMSERYLRAEEAHSKRMLLKSFFRFGWYGFHKSLRSIAESRQEMYKLKHIFKEIFPEKSYLRVHEEVLAFIKQISTADNNKQVLNTVKRVQEFFFEVKKQTGLDLIRVGLFYSKDLTTQWPLGNVKEYNIEHSYMLNEKAIQFVRSYVGERGINMLADHELVESVSISPVVMTKIEFESFVASNPETIIEGFGLSDNAKATLIPYQSRVVGFVRGVADTVRLVKSVPVLNGMMAKSLVLVSSKNNTNRQDKYFFEIALEAYRSGINKVIPIIIEDQ